MPLKTTWDTTHHLEEEGYMLELEWLVDPLMWDATELKVTKAEKWMYDAVQDDGYWIEINPSDVPQEILDRIYDENEPEVYDKAVYEAAVSAKVSAQLEREKDKYEG